MDNVESLMKTLTNLILNQKNNGSPLVVGINGIDTSGKTMFSKKLKKHLQDMDCEVQIIHIDDFHNPKSIRYYGDDEVYNYFYKSFEYNRLISEILDPIKFEKKLFKKYMALNLETDKYDLERTYKVTSNTIVILEGVFILREEVRGFLDFSIFIYVPFEIVKERAIKRDVPKFGEEILEKYDKKYIPTQKKYLEMFPPEILADIIIDNQDWNNPMIVKVNDTKKSF
ncbi:hypothetical protein RBH29_17555 [Herbivorax sp. ANBcel31]|uniref:hypothetical protein n=1 Tax=Herbivorax sp. ANBcel31 TaxID=3069754 RepID=UPI0027B25F74|nr:hypothetical protein [Herbivorax sp. ANBcel31]MDQ2088233.1 hypothetical protein [Herbivorax sp. ANBcel31]